AFLRLQVDIVANQIQEAELQILGRGVVHISDEALRIRVFDNPVQSLEVPLDPTAPEPADQGRRDLVAERVAKKSRMPSAGTCTAAHAMLNIRSFFLVDKETNILFCRQTHHYAKAMLLCGVQQRTWRHGVWNAHGVQAVCRHLSEIPPDFFQVMVLVATRIRPKCSIGHTADPKLLLANVQELACHLCPFKSSVGQHAGGALFSCAWEKSIFQGPASRGASPARSASSRTPAPNCPVVCRAVKPVGEPDAGDRHVRFGLYSSLLVCI